MSLATEGNLGSRMTDRMSAVISRPVGLPGSVTTWALENASMIALTGSSGTAGFGVWRALLIGTTQKLAAHTTAAMRTLTEPPEADRAYFKA